MIGEEQPHLTDQHGDAGLRWLLDRREWWGLNDSELACLLGVPNRTLLGWKEEVASSELVRLPSDVVERIGLLLALHKGLVNLTPSGHESMAVWWFQKPLQLWNLNGESIRSYLLGNPEASVLVEMVRRIRSATV